MEYIFTIPSQLSFIFTVPNLIISTGGSAGGTYNINVDGSLNQTGTSADSATETFNIDF